MLSSRLKVFAVYATLLFLTVMVATSCGGQATQSSGTPALPSPAYQLMWSDEFNGPDGSAPDATKWAIQTGGNGWGNHELEYYTARPQNVRVKGGNLVITAIKEDYTGSDGVTQHYTSARMQTKGVFSQQYGRFEARIKLPRGQGMWPAFWLLGNNIDTAGWPACGEIDIMENIGREPGTNHGSLHGPGYAPGNLNASYTLPGGALGDGFHLYAVEWDTQQVRFYVDSNLYGTFTPANLPQGSPWEFNKPFFILLNVAVGGDWPGPPDQTTRFPQQMLVDFVRVYQKQ